MPPLKRNTTGDDTSLCKMAELIELGRTILRCSRSLRRLFRDKAWLDAFTVEGSQ